MATTKELPNLPTNWETMPLREVKEWLRSQPKAKRPRRQNRNSPDPTPAEIKAKTKAIQAAWTDEQRIERLGYSVAYQPPPVEFPFVRFSDCGRPDE